MPDREKVIKEIEAEIMNFIPACTSDERLKEIMKMALELLKGQESVRPIDVVFWNKTYGRCGCCKAPLPALEGYKSKFCWMCGRAVKWDADD